MTDPTTTSTEAPAAGQKPRGSALAAVVGFLPWIIYWILAGNAQLSTAVLVALVLSAISNLYQYRRDHHLIALEAGTTVFFALALVLSYSVNDAWLERWMSPISNAAFFALMLSTAIIRKPFTLEYAKQSTPPELWDTPGFMYVNWALTWVWIGATGLMTAVSLVPALVDDDASLTSNDPLNIACYWVIPYSLLGLCGIVTSKFPDWFGAAFDDVDPSTEPPAATPVPLDGTSDATNGDLELVVDPRVTGLDEVPAIALHGAEPGGQVTLRTTTVDLIGHTWRAEATFSADDRGTVDTTKAEARRGSYDGVDGGGLLWAMRFATPEATPDIFVPPLEAAGTNVEAVVGHRTVSATLVRRALAEGTTVQDVRTDQVIGRLFLPEGSGPFPGTVLIGGSEGGIDSMSSDAAVLAAHGRAALVVGLFGIDGLTPELLAVPLERIGDAVGWLAAHPAVDASRMGAIGISRGAEALLLASSLLALPLSRLAVISPSSVTWPGMGDEGASPDTSGWTVGGTQLPFVPVDQAPLMPDMARQALHARGRHHLRRPPVMHLTRSYGASLNEADGATLEAARIPVERIAGPILTVVGSDDQVWPSGRMAVDVAAQRGAAGASDETLTLADCGHLVRLGIMPTDVEWTGGIALGGTRKGIADGQRATTARVLDWLP